MKKISALSFVVSFLLPLSALAAPVQAGPQLLGTYGYWKGFVVSEANQPLCYMSLSAPAPQPTMPKDAKKGASKPVKRGDVVLMITHRPAEGSRDVVSYAAGTKFKASTEAKVTVGGKEFGLFTQNDTAWSRDAATDRAITTAIRTSQTLAIAGEASKDFPIADTVNLKGAEQAYKAITVACGLPYEALARPTAPKPAKITVKTPTAPKAPAKPTAKKEGKKP